MRGQYTAGVAPGTLPELPFGRRPMFRVLVCGVFAVTISTDAFAQGYQRPPKAVTDILDTPPLPGVSISPIGDSIFLVKTARYPSIEEVAAPQLRLAGVRIDPKTNGPARPGRVTGLTLVRLPDVPPTELNLPIHGKAGFPIWSPDGNRFAVTITTPKGIELWAGELKTGGKLEQIPGVILNATIGNPVEWMPGSSDLLVQL